MSTQPTSQPTSQPQADLPAWMPGGGVDAQQEPVFSELVDELDLRAGADRP